MSLTDALVCAVAGAAAYHLYAKQKALESFVLGRTEVISLGGEFDKAEDEGDNEEGRHKVGFSQPRR